jgi:hypothetical protein
LPSLSISRLKSLLNSTAKNDFGKQCLAAGYTTSARDCRPRWSLVPQPALTASRDASKKKAENPRALYRYRTTSYLRATLPFTLSDAAFYCQPGHIDTDKMSRLHGLNGGDQMQSAQLHSAIVPPGNASFSAVTASTSRSMLAAKFRGQRRDGYCSSIRRDRFWRYLPGTAMIADELRRLTAPYHHSQSH